MLRFLFADIQFNPWPIVMAFPFLVLYVQWDHRVELFVYGLPILLGLSPCILGVWLWLLSLDDPVPNPGRDRLDQIWREVGERLDQEAIVQKNHKPRPVVGRAEGT